MREKSVKRSEKQRRKVGDEREREGEETCVRERQRREGEGRGREGRAMPRRNHGDTLLHFALQRPNPPKAKEMKAEITFYST